MANAGGTLRPGGIMCLTCPSGLGLDVTELRGGSATITWFHLNLFNPRSIGIFLDRHGFDPLAVSTPGILDVDLLKEANIKGRFAPPSLSFFDRLIHDDGALAADFQRFVVEHGLSSHMMAVARKRRAL